jgi:hypothetical protein
MQKNVFLYMSATILVLSLGACSRAGAPTANGGKPERPAANPGNAIAAIRGAGAKFDSSVEVHPLRDPAVEGLLKQAHDLEAQSLPAQALDFVRKALKISGSAPDILQYEAELLIATGDWKSGAAVAQQSYDLGPKVGALCARNLQTLVEARGALGDDAGAELARQQLSSCRVPAPVRL